MDTMREKISFLYPGKTEEVYQKLRQILDSFKKTFKPKVSSKSSSQKFSEKDVVLICYPDHVYYLKADCLQDNSLEILHQFLNKYAKGLVNKIHLLPFYPYSSDEGFSVIDYYQVRKDLGNWDNIRALSCDFDLIFDLVLNHISSKSEWFQKFLNGDKNFSSYFIAFDKKVDTSSVYRPRAHPLLTPFKIACNKKTKAGLFTYSQRSLTIGKKASLTRKAVVSCLPQFAKKYLWTTFSKDQIDLNYQNPQVFLEMVKILLFYISQGASMIRLDAIRYLWKKLGTNCVDLPQTHVIIKVFREILDEIAPNVLLISEVKGSFNTIYSYFGEGDESDLIYNFELSPLILTAFLKENVQILSSFLKNLKPPPTKKNTYFNITATHDGIGLTPLVGLMKEDEINDLVELIKNRGGLVNYHSVADQLKPYELNITYLDAAGGINPFLASQAIQLSLAGVPGIYFSSLIGGQNWIEGPEKTGENRAINRERFNYQKLVTELEDRNSIKYQVYSNYQKLLKTRVNEPLFSPLADQKIIDFHPKIFAVLRFLEKEKILCLVNVSSKEVEIKLSKIRNILEKNSFFDLISRARINNQTSNVLKFRPHQVFWLK